MIEFPTRQTGRLSLAVLGLTVLLSACLPCTGSAADETLQISNVNIVDVRAKRILRGQDLTISAGRIAAIGDHAGFRDGAFDAGGAYAVAGLYDAHVHVDTTSRIQLMLPEIAGTTITDAEIDDDLAPYLAFGVTGIVVLGGNPDLLIARARAEQQGAFLPRIVAASPILDGADTTNPVHRAIATPQEGRSAVDEAAASGYDLIKTYHIVDKATRDAIIARAVEHGMPVAGHLPPGMPFTDAIVPGFSNVAHAEEITRGWEGEDRAYLAEAVELMAQHGVSFTPNLVAYREFLDEIIDIDGRLAAADRQVVPPLARVYATPPFNGYVNDFGGDDVRDRTSAYFRRVAGVMSELTLDAQRRGVMLLAGSDTGNPTMFPGQSLYRELSLLREAGLDGYDVLAAATLNVARFLGEASERGSIDVGKVADLVLFRVNPVVGDIASRDAVLAVVRNGVLFDGPRIAAAVRRLSASFDDREARYREAALAESSAAGTPSSER